MAGMHEDAIRDGEGPGGGGQEPGEQEVVAFLLRPEAYAERPGRVDLVETHGARIFLAGAKAIKVKKRVKLPFLDFSTLELRRRACAREVELNQPHAPEIYERLVAITRKPDGGLELGGGGPVVEWAVLMRRFEQSSLLAHIAETGPLSPKTCTDLAAMAARYHRSSPIAECADGPGIIGAVVRQLVGALEQAAPMVGADAAALFKDRAGATLERLSALLAERARAGAVRRCHGDLHLGNIVLIGERPVPFDALEFNEALATIDVLYDLAFLLMDLEFRGDRRAANLVLNHYVGARPAGGEIEGLAALPLFLACRAGVRAVVAVERSRQKPAAEREADKLLARRYVAMANAFLAPPPASLVAVGGLSGTGKSTLAARLAPEIGPSPGALHVRSDVERKRLFGVEETQRLGPEHYAEAVSDKVYALLLDTAERALAASHAVVVDAVFAKPAERRAVAEIAERTGRSFAGLWLEAPVEKLVARVEVRRGDASDANAQVVRGQAARDLGPIAWTRIDAGGTPELTFDAAAAALRGPGIMGRERPRP